MTTPSPADVRRLTILLAICEAADGKTGVSVAASDVLRRLPRAFEADAVVLSDEYKHLEQDGLIQAWRSNEPFAFLEARGKHAADEFSKHRLNPVQRLRQLQDDYLEWLYIKTEVEGLLVGPTDFLTDSPGYLGAPYTGQELLKAGARLKEGGFIVGDGRYTYSAPAAPTLTPSGREIVERGQSVHDYAPASAPTQNFTTHVHGNANVANASPNATQVVIADNEWASKASEVLDVVAQAVASLPDDLRARTTELIDEARLAVDKKSPDKAKRTLTALGNFLSTTASGALGTLLSAQILALMPLFGG